jgi:WD40 repeat protein
MVPPRAREGGLAGALVLAVVVGFAGVTAQKRQAEERAAAEASERARAAAAEAKALESLYFSQIAQARLEWRSNNVPVARHILEGCDPNRRGWEWRYLNGISRAELQEIEIPTRITFIDAVAFSPDGRRFAFSAHNPYAASLVEKGHLVEIWDICPARRVRAFETSGTSTRLSFSPYGSRLVASGGGTARLWDVATGSEIRSWPAVRGLTYRPDGKSLVSCRDGRLTFWNPESGRPLRAFASDSGRATFAPDGSLVAVSGAGSLELRDVADGRLIRRLPFDPDAAEHDGARLQGEDGPEVAFSPDGRHLAVATSPPRVWDASTGALRLQLGGHEGPVPGIALSPDGRKIATAGVDSTLRLRDARTGSERSLLRGHMSWV